MYSIGSDPYLTNLLSHPSVEELKSYNQSLEELRMLWKQRNEKTGINSVTCLDIILVEGGTFVMGSEGREVDERPRHPVTVSSFLIGKLGVTCNSFSDFISDTGYQTDAEKNGGSHLWTGSKWEKKDRVNWECNIWGERRGILEKRHPVIHVSWFDAIQYCNWLSGKEGLHIAYYGTGNTLRCDFESDGYRLLTEAEWEFAARGGNKSMGYKYSGSNQIDEVAWYDGNSNKTCNVGTKLPNELGIYDMNGNVWEWCWDWRGEYGLISQNNPSGPNSGTLRVTRGGSWRVNQEFCRVSCRGYCIPNDTCSDLGFRVARTLN